MKNNGWIKLHRKIQEWEWYSNPVIRSVFIDLLLSANHEPNNWQGITINKGQVITGRKSLAERLGFSEMQIRSALAKLKSTNEITIKTTNRYSVITINKYKTYQQDNQQINSQITNKQPTDNQQITTNKNDKNGKNEKNIYTHTYTTLESVNDESLFLELANKYNTSIQVVKNAYDNLENYVGSKKNRTYDNYKKALINFLKGDLEKLAKVNSYRGGKNERPNIVFVNPK